MPVHARLDALRARFQRWLFRVHGPEPAPIRLGQRRIFVMPTAFGVALGVTLLVMLLASINYALSLGYALTFLLGGVGWVHIHLSFRNLVGLSIAPGRVEPVFAGATASFGVLMTNPLPRSRLALRLWPARTGASPDEAFELPPDSQVRISVHVAAPQRGWLPFPRLQLESRHPLGLIRAWSLFQPDLRALVFPTPEADPPPLPRGTGLRPGAHGRRQGRDDFAGLRAHQPADPPRHVAWKALARSGEWLTKQFDGGGAEALWLDWNTLPPGLDTEQRLARLTRWLCDAEAAGLEYGLRMPQQTFPPASGPAHRLACLTALALFGGPDG